MVGSYHDLVGGLLTQGSSSLPQRPTLRLPPVGFRPCPQRSYKLFCSPCLPQSSSLISSATAAALLSSGAVDYCLHVLKSLLEYWKSQQNDEEPVATSQLLKPHTTSSPPDMSPFFLRQYVKVRPFPGRRTAPALLQSTLLFAVRE